MIFRSKPSTSSPARPRITPDPNQAAELMRRMRELAYHPENGFHKDLTQARHERPVLRLVK
ncbi:MAG TPA: hypothetical protein VGN07_13350 [Steroidobacteraceae bacterium]|jgi:hypothetical protein